MYCAKKIGGIVLAAAFVASPSLADDEGYIDNWVGTFKLEAQLANDGPLPLPFRREPPAYKKRFDDAWSKNRPTICNKIQEHLREEGKLTKWISCDLECPRPQGRD